MVSLFGPDAISISAAGDPLRGQDAIRQEMAGFMKSKLPLKAIVRHVFVAGDIASVILDWSITGISITGEKVDLAGAANDVYQRCSDGYWRILIDNLLGTERRRSSGG